MGEVRENKGKIDFVPTQKPVRLKQIYYLSPFKVISIYVSICHGKAVGATDIGTNDAFHQSGQELNGAG